MSKNDENWFCSKGTIAKISCYFLENFPLFFGCLCLNISNHKRWNQNFIAKAL